MKLILSVYLLFFSAQGFSQTGKLIGHLTDTSKSAHDFPFRIIMHQAGGAFSQIAQTDSNGSFQLNNIPPGSYIVFATRSGYRSEIKNHITIKKGQDIEINMPYPKPCIYLYPVGYIPHCPVNKNDAVIPVVYGKPTENVVKEGKEGKVFLGGCVVSGCDPHYYCTVHRIEF